VSTALDARPKLKDDVKIVRREHRGRVHYIVKEPVDKKYYQFGEVEVGLMKLMDGRRTPEDVSQAAFKELGITPPAGQVADFAAKLKRMGIVERTPAEKQLMLMEHVRSDRNVRARRRTQGSILRLRFSIGDPDRLFTWMVSHMRWAWTRAFVYASITLFMVYFAILIARWDAFWGGTVGMYTLSGFGLWDWVLFYFLFFGIGAIHELGHGLTTKAFGGDVREIGGMLLYFSPALFCNTNDAWTFEKRAHRLWVTFAGPWVEMMIAGIAAIVWVTTEPATFINKLAFLTVLSAGILAVLANLNPMLPLDGYYALSDYLEIPNLRRRSFEYTGWLGKRFLLGVKAAEPPATPRERRVFIIYGISALFYSIFIAVVSAVWLVLVIGRFIGPWVWAILALVLLRLAAGLGGRSRALAQAATTTWRAGFVRNRRTLWGLAVLTLLIILPFFTPWTLRARGDLLIESQPRAQVRAEVAGLIDRWHVREGESVAAGDAIASLWNPELEAAVLEGRAAVERLKLDRAQSELAGDRASAAAASSQLNEAERDLAVLESRRQRLVVRSPVAGIVMGYRLEERIGEAAEEGRLLVEIASPEARTARIHVHPKHAGEVAPGQTVRLKLYARPHLKFVSTIVSVAPAASDGWLEAEVAFFNEDWQPAPGMTGVAKIETVRMTVAQAILRAVRQTIRVDLWL
jgi:putative peptide zinc metalloprotease protein